MINWKVFFDIINPDNTMTFNRLFAHSIGMTETVIYFSLISKCKYWESKGQLIDNEWFYSTIYDLQESTTFSKYQQKKAIDNLVRLGLIKCESKGIPAKRCFMIVENPELLCSIVENGKSISEQLKAQSRGKNDSSTALNQDDVHNSETTSPENNVESSLLKTRQQEVNDEKQKKSDFFNSLGDINKLSITSPENNAESSLLKTDQQEGVHNLETTFPENNVESSLLKTRQQEVKKLANKFAKNSPTSSEESGKLINNLNKNNLNENNLSNQSISNDSSDALPDRIDKIDSYARYKELVYSNIEYETITENSADKPKIDEIVENMLEMLCCTSPSLRIASGDVAIELVKSRVLKITAEHIDYILLCLKRNTTKVHNIKAYLRTVIYNAPSTMTSFIDADVNYFLNSQSEN